VEDVDPIAKDLVAAPLGAVMELLGRMGRRAAPVVRGIDALTLSFIEHMALRTLAIDDAVAQWCRQTARAAWPSPGSGRMPAARSASEGVRLQCVILGAGLDARAHRLDALRDVRVFEVDHPDTQRRKRRRAARAPLRCAELRYVAVDFTQDVLDERLDAAGHDVTWPTMWIWEGVTMYLPRPALRCTLATVGRRSAPGSAVALTYIDERIFDGSAFARHFTRAAFAAIGEPLLGLLDTETLRAELAMAQLRLEADTGGPEWRRRYGRRTPPLRVFDGERLAVAVRGMEH
jgi:methyltransferase (TIGR00027 family)